MTAVVVSSLLAGAAVVALPTASAATAVESSTRTASATERAAASGEPVEDVAQRSAYSTTVANPDGTFTLTQSTTPQRVKQADGTWAGVDVDLVRRADGSVGPKAAAVGLSFSGGGSAGDMIRLGDGRRSFSLDWPGPLPVPTLDGATATYADVLPGVDLRLTATSEGYRQVLAVKTAQAAASSELEQITLAASGQGLEVVAGAGGGLRAVDEDGNAVFNGPAGLMWDSAGNDEPSPAAHSLTATGSAATDGGDDPSVPGEGDATAELPVKVADGAVEVRPDLGLLRGTDTVYPVFIDPPVGLGASERTKLSSDGDKFWQFTEDKGVGLCGNADGYYCGSGYIDRMYFEFAPTKLSGKYVLDATFRAHETWSFNCDAKWLNLARTDNISEGTRWPGPSVIDHMGDRLVSAGRGDNCSPSQPDKWIEFNDDPAQLNENLTPTVRAFADGKFARLTLMLWAKDEKDPRAWKRFDKNAELQVTYVPQPGVPTSVGLIPGDGTAAYCRTDPDAPLTVSRLDPMVQARVQTKVQPKAGEEKGSLQAGFRAARKLADGTWEEIWSDTAPTSGFDPDGTLEKTRTTNRTDGTEYRYRARTQSRWSYGGKSGELASAFSPWCYFKIDSTAPKAPVIKSVSPYTLCTAGLCEGKGGPGVAGTFTFQHNPADADITGFRWRLLTASGAETKEVSGSTYTEKLVVPKLGGTQVLSVEAKDVRNRYGPPAEFTFKVALAEGEVGRWRFDDGVAGSGVTVAKDTATVGTRHDANLRTAGAGWSTMARRGEADQSLWLDSADPANQQAYASTSTAAVNTADSLTFSTWAYLTDASTSRMVMTTPGTQAQAFALYYSSSSKGWVFSHTVADSATPVIITSNADATNPPLRVWTQLTGVFDTHGDADPANDTLQLYVNGRPQGAAVKLAAAATAQGATYKPWNALGGLQFGRSVIRGESGFFFRGRIDESAVWQRALTSEEVLQEVRLLQDDLPTNELVAQWDATTATGTTIDELSPYPHPSIQLSATGAVLDGDDNALTLDGTSGYASAQGPVVDESGSFTVSARVQLNGEKLAAKPVGYKAQVAGQRSGGQSSWALWVIKPAVDTYQWQFTRTATDSSGKVTKDTAITPASDLAEVDTWVDVTGVFDAQEAFEITDPGNPSQTLERLGTLHLYVGSFAVESLSRPGFDAVQQGTGELATGRGTQGGTTGHYLPGGLEQLRIWTGAMTQEQVSDQVTIASADDTGTPPL
ncbi:LamG domain-containing protein [Streptomyces sp. 4R-3d]|uniref:LamG domain-containing protein n=1 Tax=Streptomyces sp. 4R-3d TaxID=2559605 RepID=UPI001FFE1F67|nr:LamG domain-containing protein [Streptomyces sp. 4R-3d]